ncbi:MAG: TrpB-like pyridoxal phosphate-dependent enzyme [Armatimonadota bacterium]|nr:TrpB-like pyridoxal phosphate-dependent enzyme [Armatimonadota bacterium]MCX7777268.1 TrpB-like pyridoxal phosphate-dependent enzyme [Armatimonadota bacterium]MDW8024682.1 TrpB-like pyridoxal phosphate-dependent enzyme [Armatimonadota bacterium]
MGFEDRVMLPPSEIPKQWYNIQADLDEPIPPVIHPATLQPISPDELAPIFPMALIEQEVSKERWIPIPEEVLNIFSLWRPTPLVRARRLEKYLQTPARIYYKNESLSPPGSHKPNTAVAQAYYNKREGVKRLTTETGAGQWGSALAFACNLFGLKCTVYMVRVSYEQKPYRKVLMNIWGAEVLPSPTDRTNAGKSILAQDPNSPGSLGIAISEAVEDAVTHEDTKYSLGSVLNHVLLHQTIVGLEAKRQFEMLGEYPDVLVGCVGGGSNFAGFVFPFIPDKLDDKRQTQIVAVEPLACPSLTQGIYTYDFGDTARMTPLLKMHTLGHNFIPPRIHAGGLRYHGMAPIVSFLYDKGIIEAVAYPQRAVFEAAVTFARVEGIVPAPETAHAVRAVIDEALRCKETGEEKVIAFNFSGHGYFDLSAYDEYLSDRMEDAVLPPERLKEMLSGLPKFSL